MLEDLPGPRARRGTDPRQGCEAGGPPGGTRDADRGRAWRRPGCAWWHRRQVKLEDLPGRQRCPLPLAWSRARRPAESMPGRGREEDPGRLAARTRPRGRRHRQEGHGRSLPGGRPGPICREEGHGHLRCWEEDPGRLARRRTRRRRRRDREEGRGGTGAATVRTKEGRGRPLLGRRSGVDASESLQTPEANQDNFLSSGLHERSN